MYLQEFVEQFKDKKIKLYVDMDGVIADYKVGNHAIDFHLKRPLLSSISKLEHISKLDNIELYILSVTRFDEGIGQKEGWLDKYAPFFEKNKRHIISRESNDYQFSYDLKTDFIKNIERDGSVIMVIDDDPRVLYKVQEVCDDIVLLKDTVLVD